MVRTCLPPLSFLVPSSATQYRATAVVGIACVIVCSFLIRISHPIGQESPPFQLQLAYASQYVFAYAAGTSLSKIQQYLLVSHPAGRLALTYLLAILSISLVGTVAHMTHHEWNSLSVSPSWWQASWRFLGCRLAVPKALAVCGRRRVAGLTFVNGSGGAARIERGRRAPKRSGRDTPPGVSWSRE